MKPDIVLDTNVYLEQVDLQDLVREVLRAGAAALESPKVHERQSRARAAILLAWYFHANRLHTAFNWGELTEMIMKQRRVDPNAPDDVPTVVTALIAYVVHPKVLGGWGRGSISPPKAALVGTAIDEDLLSCAQDWKIPLITNEGNTADGLKENKKGGGLNLRGKAKNLGVPVYAPGEYLDEKHLDWRAAGQEFLAAVEREFAGEVDVPLGTPSVVGRAKVVLLQLYRFILASPLAA